MLSELRTRVVAVPFAQPTVTTLTNDAELAALSAASVALSDVIADPVRWVVAAASSTT